MEPLCPNSLAIQSAPTTLLLDIGLDPCPPTFAQAWVGSMIATRSVQVYVAMGIEKKININIWGDPETQGRLSYVVDGPFGLSARKSIEERYQPPP